LRQQAGTIIAEYCGAEAACVTSGAAAGLAISVAATLTGQSLAKVRQLPQTTGPNQILLQAGHSVDFGATVEQMIRLGGGDPVILGMANSVPERLLIDTLAEQSFAAFVYVQSHHCVQDNMVELDACITHCHHAGVPVIVDAAAEEDLRAYIDAGADLVTYSGGKAFGGPTSGFIAGSQEHIAACEMQFRGIARTMKVGKEQITGLLGALAAYSSRDEQAQAAQLDEINQQIVSGLERCEALSLALQADEAGRHFSRVRIAAADGRFNIRQLVEHLSQGNPSIRTRNHHLDQGYLLIDPRELKEGDVQHILARIQAFTESI